MNVDNRYERESNRGGQVRRAGHTRSANQARPGGQPRSDSQARPGGQSRSANQTRPSGPARARAMARRRRRIRQRRMILGALFLLVMLIIGGIIFGVMHYRSEKQKQELFTTGVEALDRGEYETAIAGFDQLLEQSKGKVGTFEENVLLHRAEAEYRQGDYTAALHTYELLLKEDGENEEYKKGAVICLTETGDYGKALELEVLQDRVYSRMAADQLEAGQYDKALEYIELGKSFSDETAQKTLEYNEAVAWEYKSDYAKALELFEAYAQKYGNDETVEREIAFLKTRQGNH